MDNFVHRRIRDIGDVLTDTFQYLRIHYITLGKALAFFVLPIYLINFFVMKDYYSTFMSEIFSGNAANLSELFGWRYFAGIFLGILASASLAVVTLKHIALTDRGETPDPDLIMEEFVPMVFKMIGLTIVLGFIIFVSALFFLIPAIFLGIKLCMAASAYVIEDETLSGAMSRSWDLTKDYWWPTFGIAAVIYFLVIFITWAFAIPIGVLSVFITESGASATSNVSILSNLFLVLNGVLTAVSSLCSSILYIAITLHYFSQVERKEGGDLRSKIEGLLD